MIKSAQEFIMLRTSENPEEYRQAIYDSADLETWKNIIKSYPNMREWVVLNKTIPMEILQILLVDENVNVRTNIAMKNKLTREMFDCLSNDIESVVRNRLVYNKNIPYEILLKLSKDTETFVRNNALSKLKELDNV